MQSNNKQTLYYYAVDDKKVIHGIFFLDSNVWHAGDGRNRKGNREGISIEICYLLGGELCFILAEKRAAKLIS